MTTLAEFMIIAGADNRPSMLEKSLYDSWKSRMEIYMENRENGRMIRDIVQKVHLCLCLQITEEDGTTRKKTYVELSASEKLQADCDCKATNIILQGLPPDVYAIVNHHKVAKEIWDRVKACLYYIYRYSGRERQGTKLSLQEKECKLYDEFDKFTFVKGETLYQYYWRFAQLINNMNVINMSMRPVQVNTQFLNSLPPEWSKFVTDVKLARYLHTTNYDQLYSYLEQHEMHANETRLMRERYQDPLAFVANYHQSPSQLNNYHSQYNPTQFPQQSYMSHQTSSVPQIAYTSSQPSTQPLTEFPQMDSGLAVPVFNQGDDPIACLNKAMAFLTAVASSRFPSTNNQLRTSSNPRNQATIQDGRVTVQQVQGRQGQSYAGNSYKGNATSSGGNNAGGQARVVKCYTYQGEGHIARQCTQPKRHKNAAWFKEKAMLAEAQEAGQILDEEQLAFFADPGIPNGQTAQTTIPNTAAFQTEDLDAYDFDCDCISNAKVILMANLSNYGSDVISKVPHYEPYHTDIDNQSVHAMLHFKQTPVAGFIDNEITSDSNIIPYSKQLFKILMLHMLTKPQVFYDNAHKQALGYQNPFYLEKAQRIKPTLYDGSVISSQHVASLVIDDEETLILEELQTSHPKTDQSASSPVKIEAPRELPKVSMVNTSLKKLKYHVGQFDIVVKKRITPDAITEGE
ncbi:hypothetical protein Tco_1147623 [Tanacetum coccineum]